jgi:hypothetical protein
MACGRPESGYTPTTRSAVARPLPLNAKYLAASVGRMYAIALCRLDSCSLAANSPKLFIIGLNRLEPTLKQNRRIF